MSDSKKAKKPSKATPADNKILKKAEAIVEEQVTEKIAELVETEAIAEAIVEVEHQIDDEAVVVKSTAKAGKRSAKAVAEKQKTAEKEARKKTAAGQESQPKPKAPIKPTRSRAERRAKKYRTLAKLVDAQKLYEVNEAVALALKTSTTKFDSTVELHIRLNVDPRQADQNIRDNLVLPAGTGKKVRVAVFAEEDVASAALKAGADVAGEADFLAQLDKEVIDFDVLIATPSVMAKLSKYARVLGPKGLMPNPKSGTVTKDVNKAISAAKAGRVEYRVDSTGIVHVGVGKVSFGPDKIGQNVDALLASIKQNKPASLKSSYVRSVTISTTMGPGIKIQPSALN